MALSAALVGCGSDGGGTAQQVGTFIDDPVGGLTYSCVSGAQTLTGTTDSAGHFNYLPGQTCTFSVGKVTLGTLTGIPSDGKVTPQDVAGVARGATAAPSALVIAQFLQSLNDGSTAGKINIPTSVTTALNSATPVTLVSSSATISQADLQTLVATVPGKVLVSAATAQAALDTQISSGVVDKTAGAVSTNAPKVLNSIAITNSANPPAGLTDQLTATGYYSDGSTKDLTALASWTSSDTKTLTVDASSGVVTGVAKGSATVTATYTPTGSTTAITAKYGETVVDPTIVNLVISYVGNAITSIQNTTTAVMQAIATFSDNTTQYVSNAVDWAVSSLNGGTATVDKTTDTTGKTATLTATKEGLLSIVASYLSGTTTTTSNALALTVTPLNSIQGVAASGTAMAGATISATCSGTTSAVTATAGDDGSYSLTLPAGATGPCLMKASATDDNGNTQTYYSSVASDTASSNAVANITPVTHMVVTSNLGAEPSASTQLSAVADRLTTAKLAAASTVVQTGLSNALGIPSTAIASPLTDSLVAARLDSGVNTNAQDSAIDRVMSQLNATSTSVKDLVATFTSGNASTALTALTNLVSSKGIPTSVAAGCPYAVSGLYAVANIGASNLNSNGTPIFGALKIDFAQNKAWNSMNEFGITPDTNNPCRFAVKYSTSANINFEISRAGFIVATTFAPPAATATSATMMPAGTKADCFKPNSHCSIFQIGIPVQTGVTMNDAVGKWISVEWNLNKYKHWAMVQDPNDSTKKVSNGSEYPCVAGVSSGNADVQGGDYANTCSLYMNYFHKFVVGKPNSSGESSLGIYGCDGLYQGANADRKCSSTLETPANVSTTMTMCTTGTNTSTDCPKVSYNDGTARQQSLTSVMNVMAQGQVVGRTLAFRAPNKDLIGIFIAGPGGPATSDVGHGGVFGNVQFQEQFGVIFRPAGSSPAPAKDAVITRGQWSAQTYRTDVDTATISGTSMTDVLPDQTKSTSPLAVGQYLVGKGIMPGTMIKAISNGTYTLVCDGSNECRSNTSTTAFGPINATSLQIKELTQVYKVTAVNKGAITRSFSSAIEKDKVDVVLLDTPGPGLAYRAYVPATSTTSSSNESVSLRGNGFAVSAGTATLAQQLGGVPAGAAVGSKPTQCTMPGAVYKSSDNSCNSDSATTGRFFSLNLNY